MKLLNSYNSNFTVLMPVHDLVRTDLLKKSIYSVLNNSLKPKEFLIIVDGSISKDKVFFLNNLKKNKIVRIFFLKKIGLVSALNYGIIKSKFNIIARADSDDINSKNRFSEQINFFIENNLGGAEICDEVIIRKLGAYNFNIKKVLSRNLTISFLNSKNIFPGIHYPIPIHMQPAYKKKVRIVGNMTFTKLLSKDILSLPIYPELSTQSVKKIISLLLKYS